MGSKTKNRLVDALYLALAIVPFLLAMTLKVLTAPATEGVSITGAMIFFTVDMPIQAWPVTEAQVNSLAVMLSMLGLCLYLTHGLQVIPGSKRQLIAEWIVEKVTNLVQNSMGERFMGFVPFIGGHPGSVRAVQPVQPAGAVPAHVRSEHRSRLGYSGIYPDHLLQAAGRPVAVCEGFLYARCRCLLP